LLSALLPVSKSLNWPLVVTVKIFHNGRILSRVEQFKTWEKCKKHSDHHHTSSRKKVGLGGGPGTSRCNRGVPEIILRENFDLAG
jgi:hypothetical protein